MSKDKTDNTFIVSNATPALNEWGIPDWNDPAHYGDVAGWSGNRWRWEFYRRRDDLRECFDSKARSSAQQQRRVAERKGSPAPLGIDQPGFAVGLNKQDRRRFGYDRLPNPRIGDQPADVTVPIDGHIVKRGSKVSVSGDGAVRILRSFNLEEILHASGLILTDKQRAGLLWNADRQLIVMSPGEVLTVFSVDRPLKPQIQAAHDWLKDIFSETSSKLQRRRHCEKWLGYLRTLDANAAGASLADIAKIHRFTAGTPQSARDILKAAVAMQFGLF